MTRMILVIVCFISMIQIGRSDICDDMERVQTWSIVYSIVPPMLALIAVIVSVMLAITIRKWQATEVKTLNDTVKKLTDTANLAGVPTTLTMVRSTAEGHDSRSGGDDSTSVEKRTESKSSTNDWMKEMK